MDEIINGITEDELVAALLSALAADEAVEGALTTRALSKIVGRRKRWVRERLRDLIDEGQVKRVTIRTVNIAGQTTPVPAYRLRADNDQRSGTDI